MTKKILETLFVFSFSLLVLPLWGETGNSKLSLPFAIIPQTQKVELLKGEGLKYGQLKNHLFNGNIKRQPMGDILSLLTEKESAEKKAGNLVLKIVASSNPAPPDISQKPLTASADLQLALISQGFAIH